MKRIFSLLFAAMLAGQAWATDNFDFSAVCSSGQTLYYKITSNTEPYTAKVTFSDCINGNFYLHYTKPSGDLVIPETVVNNDITYTIIEIDTYAFRDCYGLTSVTIPNTVGIISYDAFNGCSGITSVSIPNSVVRIGNYAFNGCSSLTSVSIPNSVMSIGFDAFSGCIGLTSISIPNSIVEIDARTFWGCEQMQYTEYDNALYLGNTSNPYFALIKAKSTDITSCVINSNCIVIAGHSFTDCSSLVSITIPNSVISIGAYAFDECRGAISLTIPNTVVNIGEGAFWGVKNIVYSGNATSYDYGFGALTRNGTIDGDFIYSDVQKTQLSAYIGKGGDVVVLNGVTIIEDRTFEKCSSVTSITIPNSVTSIGENVFEYDLFSDCKNLKYNEYGNAYYLGNSENPYLWLIKAKSKDITICNINSNCHFIYRRAFFSCSNLTAVNIPQVVAKIDAYVFYKCKAATIFCEAESKPDGWNSSWNNDGGKVVWNANVQIGENNDFEFVFNNWPDGNFATLKKYKGNANTVSVPCAVFTDTVAYLVTYIDKEAFLDCENMKSVKLPAYLKGFGEYAFKNCTALESIVIPDSVSSIGDAAFYGCSSLKSIAFGKSVKTIGMSAFEKTSVEIVALPKNIRSIDNFSFAKCENLKLVYIPETVTNNEANAFVGCTNATIYCAAASQPETWSETWNANGGTVVWGYSVPADSTLELKFETNPNGTAQITGCGDVTTVNVPVMVMVDSSAYFVTGINGNAFIGGSWNLSSINVDERNQFLTSDDGVLFNKAKTTLIACPFKKNGIYTIPNTVTSIGDGAFLGCGGLQSIEIPNSVTEIGGWAFSGCAGLESITIPNSVTSIGDAAFRMCLGVTEITIPKSVVNMGCDVFAEHETPITVYCEVSRKPEGWDDNWDSVYGTTPCNVVWADNTPVAETAANAVNIYAHGNTIVVENATEEISVYDAMGRLVCRDAIHRVRAELQVNTAGLYIVKVGTVAKRVMVNE